MWLLTCDGDLFEGKRIWLRPGSTHLLGRTTARPEAGERIQHIADKSVSRKHLTIEIGQTKPGDSSKIHTRSEVKITDGSKIGTSVNGEKFSQETKILDGKEYTIKLGQYKSTFHLFWHPATLSLPSSSSKKAKSDPLAAAKETLEQADIKLIKEYVANETTHAIAKKRNTPAALQALLQARWVLTERFVEALAAAVKRESPDGTSLLEERFDGDWPNEKDYLVPSGSEPVPRPDELLTPNLDRADVFHGYVFVFLTQSQHDNLLPVITTGGGKALLHEIEPGQGRVEDVVEYVKKIAGSKGSKQFQLSQQDGKGGVVVVRVDYSGDEALHDVMKSIDMALGQRSVQQNEFLDAILTVNPSGLLKPLSPTADVSGVNNQATPSNSRPQSQPSEHPQRAVTVEDSPAREQAPTNTQPTPAEEELQEPQSATMKKRNRRFITQSRFRGFDDFDPSQFSKPAAESPAPSFEQPEQASQPQSARDMDVDEPSPSTRTQQKSRKRPAPVQEDDDEDIYAQILTTHGAMKRQKTAAAQTGQNNSFSNATSKAEASAAHVPKKKAKELNVMAEVKARRQREEEQRQKDEEFLQNALDGIDISDLRNLAQVEEMELPARERPVRRTGNEDGTSDRWDPAWNGRKNFKRFRPQGQRRDGPRLQRIMVALQEVPRKGHGIGDEYWLTSTSTNRSKSKSQSQSQSQRHTASRSQRDDGDEGEGTQRFRRGLQISREEDEEDAKVDQHLPDAPNMNSTPSQTFGTESQRKAAGKRPATQQAAGAPAVKKSRQSRLTTSRETVIPDDDEEDALKFRRRRR